MAQPTMDRPFTIALIGGGIGGLTLAKGLLKHKIPFHLYEAANAFAEIGAGVSLSPNSRQAMKLIDSAIHEGYLACTTGNANQEYQDTWFEYRMGMDGRGNNSLKAGERFAELKKPGAGLQSVHRAHFLDQLVKLIPNGTASFGKKAQRVEDLGEEKGVKIYFEDGTTAEHSAAIGADGIKSLVRESILGPESRAKFSGKYAYRGLLPMDKASQLLGEQVARNGQMHSGYGGHVLTFPIEKGATMNVVAFQSKETWEDDKWVIPMKKEDMEQDFQAWGKNVKDILSLMQKPDVWALFEHPPAETFYKGRVCLIGDAAHATTPHQGAGAGFAIEDSYVLSEILSSVTKAEELEPAFAAFNTIRRDRCLKLVTSSNEAGRLYEFQLPEIKDDVVKFQENLSHRLDWAWDEDLEQEVNDARNLFMEKRQSVGL